MKKNVALYPSTWSSATVPQAAENAGTTTTSRVRPRSARPLSANELIVLSSLFSHDLLLMPLPVAINGSPNSPAVDKARDDHSYVRRNPSLRIPFSPPSNSNSVILLCATTFFPLPAFILITHSLRVSTLPLLMRGVPESTTARTLACWACPSPGPSSSPQLYKGARVTQSKSQLGSATHTLRPMDRRGRLHTWGIPSGA
jgi:hypothetical protein